MYILYIYVCIYHAWCAARFPQEDNQGYAAGNNTLDSLMKHFVEDAKDCYMNGVPSLQGFFTLSSSVWKEIFRHRPNWHTQGEPTPMIRIACAPGVRQMAGMCHSGTTGGMQPGEQPLAVTHRGGHRALCMICQEGKMKGSCRRICSISAIWV